MIGNIRTAVNHDYTTVKHGYNHGYTLVLLDVTTDVPFSNGSWLNEFEINAAGSMREETETEKIPFGTISKPVIQITSNQTGLTVSLLYYFLVSFL